MKRPEIYIKDQDHQKEIEAKLERGIRPAETHSIYHTGLGLQNKLIDEEKIAQMVSNEPTQESYKEMIKKLKDNPKLLLDIIPSSKSGGNRLRERLKRSHQHNKNIVINSSTMGAKIRPGTSGTQIPVAKFSRDNTDLIGSYEKPESSASHYTHKSAVIHPRLGKLSSKLISHLLFRFFSQKINKRANSETFRCRIDKIHEKNCQGSQ